MIQFYFSPNEVDPNWKKDRNKAFSSQIGHSLNIIAKYEKQQGVKIETDTSFRPHPVPKLKDISIVHWHWQQHRQKEYFSFLLQKSEIKFARQIANQTKIGLADCISLLASSNGIPENAIPVIKFDHIQTVMYSMKERSPFFESINNLKNLFKIQIEESRKLLITLKVIGDEKITDNLKRQTDQLSIIIHKFKRFYDSNQRIITIQFDCSDIYDFVSHPTCLVYAQYTQYCQGNNSESYWNLIQKLISTFDIKNSEEILIIYAMFSNAIAPLSSPTLTMDGIGPTDMNDFLLDFDLFISHDPLVLLNFLYERSKNEQNSIVRSIRNIHCLTEGWSHLFKFIYNFTNEHFLPSHLNDVRKSIVDLVNG